MESLLEAFAQERIDKSYLDQVHLRIQVEKKQKLKGPQMPALKDALAVLQNPKRKAFLEDLKKGTAPDLSVFQTEK